MLFQAYMVRFSGRRILLLKGLPKLKLYVSSIVFVFNNHHTIDFVFVLVAALRFSM